MRVGLVMGLLMKTAVGEPGERRGGTLISCRQVSQHAGRILASPVRVVDVCPGMIVYGFEHGISSSKVTLRPIDHVESQSQEFLHDGLRLLLMQLGAGRCEIGRMDSTIQAPLQEASILSRFGVLMRTEWRAEIAQSEIDASYCKITAIYFKLFLGLSDGRTSRHNTSS